MMQFTVFLEILIWGGSGGISTSFLPSLPEPPIIDILIWNYVGSCRVGWEVGDIKRCSG